MIEAKGHVAMLLTGSGGAGRRCEIAGRPCQTESEGEVESECMLGDDDDEDNEE